MWRVFLETPIKSANPSRLHNAICGCRDLVLDELLLFRL
jgi:hypothetical protein